MKAIRKTIFMTFLLALVTAGLATTGFAQYGANDAAIRDVVRRIQTRTDSLQRAVQNAADRNNYRVDDVNRLILDFENAANQLDRRLGSRRGNNTADAQRSEERRVGKESRSRGSRCQTRSKEAACMALCPAKT